MDDIKKLFPIFEKLPNLHYLDSGATTLKPGSMVAKMMEYYTEYSANIHRGLYPTSMKATDEYEAAREKLAHFIGANNVNEVIFTGGTTDGLNQVAWGWGEENVTAGQEIITSEMEHHSNLVPWQELARRKGATLKFLNIDDDYRLSLEQLKSLVTSKTALVALTQVSNVLGTVNPIKEMVEIIKKINPNTVVVVDGAQAVAHMKVNVSDLGVDFYAISGHKMYGPTGVGVLWINSKTIKNMRPAKFGGGMIKTVEWQKATWADGAEKYEAGTPPIGEVIGLGAAVDFLEDLGWEKIEKRETEVGQYLLDELNKLEAVKIIGPKEMKNRTAVISVWIGNGGSSHDYADILGSKYEVCVRAGHHCVMPLHEKLNIGSGTTRASVGIYNTVEDAQKMIEGIRAIQQMFNK